MQFTIAELGQVVGGRVVGDGRVTVCEAATLAAVRAGQITFIDSVDKLPLLASSSAAAVVVPPGAACSLPAIEVDDVHAAFARIVALFRPPRPSPRIGRSPSAVISPSARLADDVDVYPGAFIGDDVQIGAGSTIHAGAAIMAGSRLAEQVTVFPGAVLYEDTRVGPRSIIHAAAVIGAYGFGYRLCEGRYVLSAQLGHVQIGADVEIGAGSTIDRGTYGPTVIGDGTKIDNLVMIGHNCVLGRHNMICSQVGIAGSTTTGDYVVMAGQVGVRDHVHIGRGAMLGAQCGVSNDVPEGQSMLGSPATALREQRLMMAAYARLPEMRKQFKALQAAVAELQRHIEERGRTAA